MQVLEKSHRKPKFLQTPSQSSLKVNSYNCSLILTIYRTVTINGSPTIVRALYRAYLELNDIKLNINKLVLPPSFNPSLYSVKKYKKIYGSGTKKVVFGRDVVAGSCNGLVLILSGTHHIAICNPAIEQEHAGFKLLPCINYRYGSYNYYCEEHYQDYQLNYENPTYPRYVSQRFNFRVYGFGYDNYSHCFKIISLTPKTALIYSLMKDSHTWREIALPDFKNNVHNFAGNWEEKLYIRAYNRGIPTNNHLHWNITKYDPLIPEYSWEMILNFDLPKEEWGEVPVPDTLDQKYCLQSYILKSYIIVLGEVNGCLCLLLSRGISYPHLELCIMKEYGMKESWTNLCNVPNGSGVPLVYRTARHELLLPGAQHGSGWYNPKENRIRKVEFHGCKFTGKHYYSTRVKMCIESFVHPFSSIEGGQGAEEKSIKKHKSPVLNSSGWCIYCLQLCLVLLLLERVLVLESWASSCVFVCFVNSVWSDTHLRKRLKQVLSKALPRP